MAEPSIAPGIIDARLGVVFAQEMQFEMKGHGCWGPLGCSKEKTILDSRQLVANGIQALEAIPPQSERAQASSRGTLSHGGRPAIWWLGEENSDSTS
jgi:hypothetical protein